MDAAEPTGTAAGPWLRATGLGVLLVVAPAWLSPAALSASLPRGRAAPATSLLRACPFAIPDTINAPTVVQQDEMSDDEDDDGASGTDDGGDDDSDDDDDDDDDGSDDDTFTPPAVGPGWVVGDGCVYFGGEVDASMQAGRVGGALTRGFGRALDVTTYAPKSTFTIRQLTRTDYGDVVTRFAMDIVPGNATINRASIVFGNVVAGMDTSFFDAWAADEFSFRALASSQSPTVLGYVYRPTPNLSVSVSLEDQTFRRVTISGYAGQSVPDVVGQLRYANDTLDVTLSAAARETRLSEDPSGTIHGFAALASVKYTLPFGSGDSYLIAQGAWAHQAPGYLGINTTNSAFQLPLSGIFGAAVAERARGWNTSLVGYWQINPTWSSAAFVTRVSLDVLGAPPRGITPSLTSWRSAVNISWQPTDSFAITLEAGRARLDSRLQQLPSSHTNTLILSFQRTF